MVKDDETIMENDGKECFGIECRICFEPPVIPVYFVCFPCDASRVGPSCNSITRVCLTCARRYLELDVPKKQRCTEKRCLHCQTVVNPRLLNAFSAYKKDYLLMTMDSRVYDCIHDGCDFVGTQIENDHHIRSDCPHRLMYCHGCRGHCKANRMDLHIQKECQGYANCPHCQERILQKMMNQHMCDAHKLRCCHSCQRWMDESRLDFHAQEECPFRFVKCTYCNVFIMSFDLCNHYRLELEWITSERLKLNEQQQMIQNSIHHFTRIGTEIENLLTVMPCNNR